MDCSCMKRCPTEDAEKAFSIVRENCPVLKDIIIPNDIWQDYKEAMNNPVGLALHQPIMYSSFKNNCLFNLTRPIHIYILDKMKQELYLQRQYKKDLQEKWFNEKEEVKRNKYADIFMSRIAEILIIKYLASSGLIIENYEAIGAKHDVVYKNNDVEICAEIKYIGQEKDDFLRHNKTIREGSSAEILSLYLPYNFLIFKVFEAAKQLTTTNQRKVVYIIISDPSINRFQLQIEDKWFKWLNPQFKNDDQWSIFLNDKRKRDKKFKYIDVELETIISSLDEIHIFHLTNKYMIMELDSWYNKNKNDK